MIRIAVFVASSRVPPTCTRMRPERPSRLRRSAADSWLNDPTTFAAGSASTSCRTRSAAATTSGFSTVAITGDDFQHQVRRRGEVLVEVVSDLCRFRGRVGETTDAKLLGHRAAEDDADGE